MWLLSQGQIPMRLLPQRKPLADEHKECANRRSHIPAIFNIAGNRSLDAGRFLGF